MTDQHEPVSVVIADDDADMRMLVEIAVRKAGLALAAVATDGDEAWQFIREHKPDLIVLDVSMPGMSGLDVCRYNSETMAAELGDGFSFVKETREIHTTPFGTSQAFFYGVFRRK